MRGRQLLFFVAYLCGSTETYAATNLVPWTTISNAWHSVPTNELAGRASDGDAAAQCYLGMAYLEGLGSVPTNSSLARQWLLKSANQSVALSQNVLGLMAANGIDGKTNLQEAVDWYQKAADQGFSRAEVNLARSYWAGAGVPKDVSKASEWYRKAAMHGLLSAKGELGWMLLDEPGLGSEARREGLRWLREGAKEGDAGAQNSLGWIYWKELGVEQDLAEARRLFLEAARQGSQMAMENLYLLACKTKDWAALTNLFTVAIRFAEQGQAPAQFLVATMYSGLGVAPDTEKSLAFNERAARQDYGPALEALGDYYHNSGPHQDRKQAYQYYKRAAAKGSVKARERVAALLLSGEAGILDEKEGLAALLSAAEAGNLSAQYDLATRYKSGRGVPTNIQSAIHWYSRAADRTNWVGTQQTWAAMILGLIYAKGDGVPRDDAKAFRWFEIGASTEGRDAQDSLGYCYATGCGVEQDDEQAVYWFKVAASEENEDDKDGKTAFYAGVANLGVMYALGRGGLKKDPEKAAALFEKATRHAFAPSCFVPHAQTALAICLFEGRGTKGSSTRAFKLFHEAADFGEPQAQLHTGLLYWRGEGTKKDLINAYTYLEAAALNKEPTASEWCDRVAKELNGEQRTLAAAKAASIATARPPCDDPHGRKIWNFGLRIPNLFIAELESAKPNP